MESRNGASSRPARSMVNARGEFTGAHNPAAPHWSQIQNLAVRMTLFFRDVAACLRAARPSHVASQCSSTTIGFLPRTSMRVDSASGSMWVGLVNFVVDNFPLSIRAIGIDRKFRWTGFGPLPDPDAVGKVARKRPLVTCDRLRRGPA